jgi:bacterioferritin
MKSNQQIIAALNDLLSDELTATLQYMVHSEMCKHWGYEKLHEEIEKKAIDEMRHAEWHIGRILFLEGIPVVSNLKTVNVASNLIDIIKNDEQAEAEAIIAYNKAIALAGELEDESTADSLVDILHDEEGHLDWAEKQLAQVEQMGFENYIAQQLVEGE